MKLTTLNSTSITNQITTYFSCDWSDDGHIYVLTDSVVYVLQLMPNMKSRDNKFNLVSTDINLSKYFAVDHLGYRLENILNSLSKENFYASVLNSFLTPHLENINPATIIPIKAKWSSEGMHNVYYCMIAVLSNTGNIEIFAKYENQWNDEWILLTNVTEYWIKILMLKWDKPNDNHSPDDTFKIIKDRVQQAICTSFTWSTIYEREFNNYCYLFLGHGDGNISVWKINHLQTIYKSYSSEDFKIEPSFVYSNKVSLNRISELHCHTYKDNVFLIVGDIKGLVKFFPIVSIDCTNFKIGESISLWEHSDVRVSKIVSMNYEDGSVILCVKGPFIILFYMEFPWKLKITETINMGNLNVTDIIIREHSSFLVSTQTGMMKIIKLLKIKDQIKIQLIEVKTDINMNMMAVHGLMKSPRSVLWGILTYPRKLFDHLTIRNPGELTFCYETDVNPAQFLNQNKSEKLFKYWESMESIRCLSIKNNKPPFCWLVVKSPINFATISMYELRVLYWSTQILCTLSRNRLNSDKEEKIVYNLTLFYKILMLRFQILRINWLLDKVSLGRALTTSERHSLYLLYDAVLRAWENIGIFEAFNEKFEQLDRLVERMKDVELPDAPACQICEEDLTGEKCKNDIDQRCCITNLQLHIGNTGWICKTCRRIVHEDVREHLFCPVCDIPLTHYEKKQRD